MYDVIEKCEKGFKAVVTFERALPRHFLLPFSTSTSPTCALLLRDCQHYFLLHLLILSLLIATRIVKEMADKQETSNKPSEVAAPAPAQAEKEEKVKPQLGALEDDDEFEVSR